MLPKFSDNQKAAVLSVPVLSPGVVAALLRPGPLPVRRRNIRSR